MILKEKRDGNIKDRGVADQRKQCNKIKPKDAAFTTVLTKENNWRTQGKGRGGGEHTRSVSECRYEQRGALSFLGYTHQTDGSRRPRIISTILVVHNRTGSHVCLISKGFVQVPKNRIAVLWETSWRYVGTKVQNKSVWPVCGKPDGRQQTDNSVLARGRP